MNAVLLGAAIILALEPGSSPFQGARFGGGLLLALWWPRGIVRRCLRCSPCYRAGVALTVGVSLVVAFPGASGNAPPTGFDGGFALIVAVAGAALFVGWLRAIRPRP